MVTKREDNFFGEFANGLPSPDRWKTPAYHQKRYGILTASGSGPPCYARSGSENILDFSKALRMVDAFFERHQRPWALAGAAALSVYGLSRATQDLDFIAEKDLQDQLISYLESEGYRTLYRSAGYSNHLHSDAAGGRLDFVYVTGDTSRRLFEGCRAGTFAGRPVRVPRPEHLAAMKVQAMKNDPHRRLQDLADVRFLLDLPDIDEEEVRGYFERAGLLRDFHEIRRTD